MGLSKEESFNRALDLFIESLYKPDAELRTVAKGEGVLLDLLVIRDHCIAHCRGLRK